MTDAYRSSLAYLYGRLNYERLGMPRSPADLGLRRIRRLLRALDDPQDGLTLVHVAGTKGKGSTSSMIATALQASGRKTGLFCSPHLHRLEERFTIDGRPATPEQLVDLVEAVRPVVDRLDPIGTNGPATFFEVTTAMGLLAFARAGADAAVIEVGLGGRLDSTNAIRPAVSVITSISFDHMRLLGNTLGQIAREKAGILKRRGLAVSGVVGDEPRAAIERVAAQRFALLREIDRDFRYQYEPPQPPITGPTAGRARVETWRQDWGWLDLPLPGLHQAQNVATSLATLDALAEVGLEVGREAVLDGLRRWRLPARVEVLGRSPWLVVDGAHNAASAEALAETLAHGFPPGPRTLIFGTTREKDLEGQLRALLPLFSRVIAAPYLENPRALSVAEVVRAVEALSGRTPITAPGPAEALAIARQITPDDGLICCTGSLFLAAEVRASVLGIESVRLPEPLPT